MDLVLEFGALRLQLASSRGIARLACNWAIIQQQLLLCSVGGLWVVGLAWIWMFGTCQLEPGAGMFELYQFVITSASTSGYMFAVVMVTAADQTLDIRLHCIFFSLDELFHHSKCATLCKLEHCSNSVLF